MSAYCCIKLDLLLTLNHDARNHEFKIYYSSSFTREFVKMSRVVQALGGLVY